MDIVILSECENVKAQKIQLLLLQNNIECEIREPSDVLNTMTSGGITPLFAVYVNSEDFETAKEIIKQLENDSKEELSWCPECGSEKIEKTIIHEKHGPKWMLYIMIVFVIASILSLVLFHTVILPGIMVVLSAIYYFKPHTTTKCLCKDCGHKFTHY